MTQQHNVRYGAARRDPECPECDAQWNASAVASVAYQQEMVRLTETLIGAHHHGLTVADLHEATGLDEEFVLGLLLIDGIRGVQDGKAGL